jgi:murein L,D-transpeptidase YcbB/YkuD
MNFKNFSLFLFLFLYLINPSFAANSIGVFRSEWLGFNTEKPLIHLKNANSIQNKSVTFQVPGFQIDKQYELLANFVERYRILDQKGDFFRIKLDKNSYKVGDSSEIVGYIKMRLSELGDFKFSTTNYLFDTQLEQAVKKFQMRHGIMDDGLVGKETIAELNVNYKQRIKQLLVNMDRCPWIPESINYDYLIVNIPEFKLHVFNSNKLQWSCNVVVGKLKHKTVIFNADMEYIVFSPYWNVPKSIVKNEILKDIRKDSDYLSKHHMEITSYKNGFPEIRQKPGPFNALGLVKFIFPNQFNIYLHDTPSKSLFKETSRAFSHGCIRVSEPFKLAKFLLRNDSEWTDNEIVKAMNLGNEKQVNLKAIVSVFTVYFTSFVDQFGDINFRKDIYNVDK